MMSLLYFCMMLKLKELCLGKSVLMEADGDPHFSIKYVGEQYCDVVITPLACALLHGRDGGSEGGGRRVEGL